MNLLSRTEEMLLLMICKLGEGAYAMRIREEVQQLTGKVYSIGGIYVPLDRLVKKGYATMHDEMDSPERPGRPRRRFEITMEGLQALREIRQLETEMWAAPEIKQKLDLLGNG